MRAVTGRPLEIVCDESGYEGDRLIGGETTVFAHGSVHLDVADADALLAELRDRIGSPATEYKANHLQRSKHRPVLRWLLGPQAPLLGAAHVFLVDKAFLVVRTVLETLMTGRGPGDAAANGPLADAHSFYHGAPLNAGAAGWHQFLVAANNLLRINWRLDSATVVQAFFEQVEHLYSDPTSPLAATFEQLRSTRIQAEAFRVQVSADPHLLPPLDPLLRGIVGTVRHWASAGRPVKVLHDRQNALSKYRIGQLERLLTQPELNGGNRSRLAELTLAPSRTDARIQLADIVAGTVRGIAEAELNGTGDAELTTLIRPYIDHESIWGDDRTWLLLTQI